MSNYTATYSPEDNKLRLYASSRLDPELYNRVRAAGFRWAPSQKLFVAPSWSPKREDLLIELAGEVGDEDTSLAERAEERAGRFEGYSSSREKDAESAKNGVKAIADNIPFGQPILIGHHSEKRARRDAQKIENGMRKAVKMWETSEYWKDRAAGAIHHAKYKELPRTRARRIKKIEAENRKMIASYTPRKGTAPFFEAPFYCPICKKCICEEHPEATEKVKMVLCGQGRDVHRVQESRLEAIKKSYARAIQHNENRLIYERAMLEEQGASDLLKPKARPKQLPICNYRAPEGINIESRWHKGELKVYEQVEMTKAEFKRCYEDYRGTWTVDNSHRVRMVIGWDKKERKAKPSFMGGQGRIDYCVYLTDSKEHKRPEPIKKEVKETPIQKRLINAMNETHQYKAPERTEYDDLKDRLKEGVQTVSVPQLFPTPPETAAYMAELAEIEPGMDILEPSAGTGNLIKSFPCIRPNGSVTAVEKIYSLGEHLKPLADKVICSDFLECNGDLGKFDRIVMNPPFKNGEDIKHIEHAKTFLKPGGVLVALCAGGPRQKTALEDTAELWKPQDNIFKNQGTNVNSVIMVYREPEPIPETIPVTELQLSLF